MDRITQHGAQDYLTDVMTTDGAEAQTPRGTTEIVIFLQIRRKKEYGLFSVFSMKLATNYLAMHLHKKPTGIKDSPKWNISLRPEIQRFIN